MHVQYAHHWKSKVLYTTTMSAWSKQRKLSIIMTIVVIVAFVLSGILFSVLHKPPSCDDGKQNGLELGVDCGGICPMLCVVEPKKLLDVWTRSFLVAEGVYAAVAYIENQNEDLYVPEVQFEIELYNKDNKMITRASSKTPIMPNGVTPIFVPHMLTGQQKAVTASFRFTEEPMFQPVPSPYGFDITDIYIETPEDKPPYARALVTNVGELPIREVDFIVILYDEENIAIAASRTFKEDMRPQETQTIQYSWVRPLTLRKGQCPGGLCTKQVKRVEIVPIVVK